MTTYSGRGLCLPLSSKSKASIACHAAILPGLVKVGVRCGYAIAAHGSLRRDIDLIAVPWIKEAVSDIELVERLAKVCGGQIIHLPMNHPHRRRSWQIHLGGPVNGPYNSGPYIDISVVRPDAEGN